ncbi:MAG: heme exporter protein CcmB [Bacteroidia bacterium]|nr:heme exporter protein CcmB [Bacteroidia bacterium]
MIVFKTVFIKDLTYFWRYKLNAILSWTFSLFVCIVLLYFPGLNSIVKEKGSLAIIAPYFMWLIMSSNFTINQLISSDSITGVIEQYYINTSDYLKLLFVRCISSATISVIPLLLFIIIISFIAQINTQAFLCTIPIIILGIPSIWGLSLIAGSLVLRFKRIDTLISIISIILFAGVSYFSTKSKLFAFVMPFAYASRISFSIVKNMNVTLNFMNILIIIANSFVYLLVGIICFRIAEKSAKKLGILGMH